MLEAKLKLLIVDLKKTLIVLDDWEQSTTDDSTLLQIEARREAYENVLTKLKNIAT